MAAAFPLNLFDATIQSDPYNSYREMRELGPVLWNPLMNAWMVWRYDDVMSILREPETYSSTAMRDRARQQASRRGEDYVDNFGAPTMLNSDPPDHDRYRGVVARAFTPRAIGALEPALRKLAHELLRPLATSGSCDIVATISSPLPILAIASMLGVESRDTRTFRQWSDEFVTEGDFATDEERLRSLEASIALRSYFDKEISRRGSTPAGENDDLLSRLVRANEGGVLSEAELLASCVLLLVAGNETTTNLITNMALQLARHPEQHNRLSNDRSLISGAVEETLRYDGPVHWTIRSANQDVDISGHSIPAGDVLFLMVAAANRDPEKFSDPDTYDITRNSTNHLGFGHGIHSCLGSVLARLEARVAIDALVDAAPTYRLRPGAEPLKYTRSNLRSPRSLPIERT